MQSKNFFLVAGTICRCVGLATSGPGKGPQGAIVTAAPDRLASQPPVTPAMRRRLFFGALRATSASSTCRAFPTRFRPILTLTDGAGGFLLGGLGGPGCSDYRNSDKL